LIDRRSEAGVHVQSAFSYYCMDCIIIHCVTKLNLLCKQLKRENGLNSFVLSLLQLLWYHGNEQQEAQLSLRICRSYWSFNYMKVIHEPQYKSGLKAKKRK